VTILKFFKKLPISCLVLPVDRKATVKHLSLAALVASICWVGVPMAAYGISAKVNLAHIAPFWFPLFPPY
jgi:hypothetical protein